MPLSYETLDTIADSFSPLIALFALALIVNPLRLGQRKMAMQRLKALAALLVLIYGFMLLDMKLDPDEKWAIDYSTHTAFALCFCAFNWHFEPRWRLLWPLVLLAYLLLMLYQGYHPFIDIIITLMLTGPITFLLLGRSKGITSNPQ
ncbi:hypothetical protein P2G88_16090 [Aliiglaciecola sp. CAU 1673]|uniref:hypothetical protein n=1 Tax=Aliiglaciecola sp. CAU 1673 TaxID=3032595 RepID=UPI0023DB79D8|nr:hypothetical protein [Aliiglaciecola sp. CAU 1673]MDF2179772.1 hypothetical protein [Aliiglaciecola sp. CAU 1673]